MEYLIKHRDVKLVTTKIRRKFSMSEPNYHTIKFFTENLLVIEIKKKNRDEKINEKIKINWINER